MTNWQYWHSVLEAKMHKHLLLETDSTHDLAHLQRVWRHCQTIANGESIMIDNVAMVAAVYLHDLVNLPKNSPDRAQASRQSAKAAIEQLKEIGFPASKLSTVRHAIEAHSYSAQIEAISDEARILQDADRLDALGALGIARTFYIAGRLQSTLFDPADPLAENRQPDDGVSAVDHFYTKLLHLPDTMHTATARNLALQRVAVMRDYLAALKSELVCD